MPSRRVVVAGGTGFLGRALSERLRAAGGDVIVLTRHAASANATPETATQAHAGVRLAHWQPDGTSGPWAAFLQGAHAVVNLTGESIAARRWSAAQKARLRESRLDPTRSLVAAARACRTPPTVFVGQSGVGYYGLRGDEPLTEQSSPGSDFMADLCAEWEATARQAADAVQRVVIARTGLVLDREGGALPRMLAPFRFFVGGPVASGRQYLSWIHLHDWVSLITWLIDRPVTEGPFNVTSPEPVTSAEFARTVGRALHRPSFVPAPAFMLRALFGEMADALLVGGQRVVPERALALGFTFQFADLASALRDLLT